MLQFGWMQREKNIQQRFSFPAIFFFFGLCFCFLPGCQPAEIRAGISELSFSVRVDYLQAVAASLGKPYLKTQISGYQLLNWASTNQGQAAKLENRHGSPR